jgi:hypothetical protein
LTLRLDSTIGLVCGQDIGVEEVADLVRSTVLGSRSLVVCSLRIAVRRARSYVPGRGEDLGSHESVVALSIIGSVDGVFSIGSTSLVSSRSLDLVGDIAIGSGNYDAEATTSLTSVDSVIL